MTDLPALPPIVTTQTTESPPSIWDRLIPSRRDWFLVGSFILVWYLLDMVKTNPKLLAVASFVQIATVIIGLLLLIGQNLFGGTKVGTETMAATNAAVVKQAASTPPPDSTTTTTTKTTGGM